MPRYEPRGPVEAHKMDNGKEYFFIGGDGGFIGLLDAALFERVFKLAPSPYGTSVEEQLREDRTDLVHAIAAKLDREIMADRPLPGVLHQDAPPAAETLAAAIAARTEPGAHAGPVVHIGAPEVEAAIAEVRLQIEQEAIDRTTQDWKSGGAIAYGTKLKPGQNGGRGRKVCQICWVVNALVAPACRSCGVKFPKPRKAAKR